jgi:hypothetical protein
MIFGLKSLSGVTAVALVVVFSQVGVVLSQPGVLAQAIPQPNDKARVSSTLHGDKAHPAKTLGWLDTELYFGLGPADNAAKGVSEQEWRAFLDKEVTPRFPSGLSVFEVYGQWQGKEEKAPERIRSKMLTILYPKTAANEAAIEAIRRAWKAKTGDQSVLRVSRVADVSF